MKKNIVVIHFYPIEIFPPAINILKFFSEKKPKNLEIIIVTTFPDKSLKLITIDNIKIIRCENINVSASGLSRLIGYIKIYTLAIRQLFKLKPSVVFYFETLSSLPALFYKSIYKSTKLYIHYHEIVTKSELRNGRLLNRVLNLLEQKFYKNTHWISQTNLDRLKTFTNQNDLVLDRRYHKVLPNYPSKHWRLEKHESLNEYDVVKNTKTRFLHIGSLSFETMYLKELLNEFGNSKDFTIDFFSHTNNKKIISYLKTYKNVTFKGSINYNEISKLKNSYDVGLVLYKGESLNFTINAPNKIFEYLALDLDVWCSDKLTTAHNYKIENTFPKMLMINYEKLSALNIELLLNRQNLKYKPSPYFSESIYSKLLDHIINTIN